MTEQEAIKNIKALNAVCWQKDFYDEEFARALAMAIKALEKQVAVQDVLERLEEEKSIAFLTLANTGDSKYDLAYDNVMAYIDKAIEIVKEGLK